MLREEKGPNAFGPFVQKKALDHVSEDGADAYSDAFKQHASPSSEGMGWRKPDGRWNAGRHKLHLKSANGGRTITMVK